MRHSSYSCKTARREAQECVGSLPYQVLVPSKHILPHIHSRLLFLHMVKHAWHVQPVPCLPASALLEVDPRVFHVQVPVMAVKPVAPHHEDALLPRYLVASFPPSA